MLSTSIFISLRQCPTPFPSSSPSFLRFHLSLPSKFTRIMMSAHSSNSPLPDDRIVVGCGGATMDYLLMVDGFPKPDEKIRGTSSKVQGGGNVGNALTCAARLGLRPRIIAKVKVAEDVEGRGILEELEADGVDTSFIVVSEEGRSMYSYVIVDSKMKTRTAIYYPGYPPMTPTDFSGSSLSSALDGANLVYFDGLSLKTALAVAREARRRGIPILVDAEMGEEGFDNLLNMSDYAVCSAKYPQAWTNAPSMATALVAMLIRLPSLKYVIVTLGEEGCIMLQRSHKADDAQLEEMNADQCLASLYKKKDSHKTYPTCISSPVLKLEAPGLGTLSGRLLVGTAERIPHLELVDTTGAGDAFIGAVLYDMLPEKMLPFAAQVAAGCCRAFGARTGLPHITEPRLQPFLDQNPSTSSAQ
uniref:Carbohydrate kinase PfkB domain-containing protein n=1 Tax=Chenopodium quinoa TaxID=63459 RepID=A0A803LAE2_CHEQI